MTIIISGIHRRIAVEWRVTVSMAGQRVAEAKKLGFDTVILPEVCKSSVGKVSGINLVYVSWIQDAIRYIMKNNYKL